MFFGMTTTSEQAQLKRSHESERKLLDSALYVFRAKGYSASTVDDICSHAGLTKGSFFYHFKSKEDLALRSVDHFSAMANRLFSSAPYHILNDPLERLLGYIDFRISILVGSLPEYTCLLGTIVQEAYDTHPNIRGAIDRALTLHIDMLSVDIEKAKQQYAPNATWTADSLSYLIQSVLQGSFIFAKAYQSPRVVRECLEHLHCHVSNLFRQPITQLRQENS